MKIDAIRFVQGEAEEGAIPSEIAVTMTLEEAAVIAEVFGSFSDTEMTRRKLPFLPEVYEVLCGDVFNRYWDDGVDGAVRHIRRNDK